MLLPVYNIILGDVLAKRVGQREAGRFHLQDDSIWFCPHMAVESLHSRLDVDSICLLCTNEHRKHLPHLVEPPFLAIKFHFSASMGWCCLLVNEWVWLELHMCLELLKLYAVWSI